MTKTASLLKFFFFNDTATTEIYTLSLHDALPICPRPARPRRPSRRRSARAAHACARDPARDRKSTRLNSSHSQISYAVFCLKKKNKKLWHLRQCSVSVRCSPVGSTLERCVPVQSS